ncbi:MAG: hypothetical protein IJX76_06645 [Clostridia bacterium]|nr:hypothetical protein [Clostridia bacterium]
MGLQYLIIGCFFLLNPYFSIIDVIPDFIGCIFLLKGLSKASKVSESFADAYRQFGLLLLVTLGRIFTIPLMANTEEVWPLIIVFCFGLGEAYLSIRGFNGIFDGLSYTARSPESALFTKWRETRQFTVFFLIAKQVLCFLPELSLLSDSDYGVVTPEGVQSLANYRLVFHVLAMILCLFIGIAWFIQIRGYFKRVMLDKYYQIHLLRLYKDRFTGVSSVYISANLRTAMTLMMVATVLSVELIFDGVNYLPHLVSCIFFGVAAYKLAHLPGADLSSAKKTGIFALLYGVLSIPRFVYSIIFSNRIFGEYLNSTEEGLQFAYTDILQDYLLRDFEAIDGLVAQVVMAAIEAALLILLLLAFYNLLREAAQKHTHLSIPAPPVPEELEYVPRPKDEFAVSFGRLRFVSLVLGIITAVSMVIATAAPAVFPSYWLIDTILRTAWVVTAYLLVSKLRDEIESHYSITIREDQHDLTH